MSCCNSNCSCGQTNCTCRTSLPQSSCSSCGHTPCSCNVHQCKTCPTIIDENHCEPTECGCNCNLYVTTTASFTIPACGESTTIYVKDAKKLVVGAYLYAENVGYLKISNIIDNNTINAELTQEICDANCNELSPGSTVALCTQFIVTALGCNLGAAATTDSICLTSSFFAPSVGDTPLTIAVSKLGNITSGATISIEGYKYQVTEVVDSNTIKIINTGEGATPGEQVGEDCTVECTVVDVLDTPSPCSKDPVSSGVLVVCDGENETILKGDIDNQIPVWDKALDKFVLEVLNTNTIECTTLTACLILDPAASPQEYLIEVADSSIFAPGSYQTLLIYINGDPFTVLSIVDPTHIRISPFFTVSVITEYDPGVAICLADCCEQCAPTIETLGRFGGEEGDPVEKLIVVQDLGFSIPVGVSVRNYFTGVGLPNPAATTDPLVAPPTDDGLYEINYTNNGACKRYFELFSNCSGVLDIPTGVLANLEFRTGNSEGNTQSFARMPLIGNDDMGIADPAEVGYVDTNQPGNLFQSPLKDLNTYDAMLYDRVFVDPAQNIQVYGHIRLTFKNTTAGALGANFESNIRAWYKTWNFELGPNI